MTDDPLNPSIGIERAWVRLRTFREEHSGLPLEVLHRGATGDWARFYVEVDPAAAEEFIAEELRMVPGDIELWALLGRVHRELGDFRESAALLLRAQRMVEDSRVLVELARTYLASGGTPRLVSSPLDVLRKKSKDFEPLENRLLRIAGSLDQFEPVHWERAREMLEPLWTGRFEMESTPRERVILGEMYARALLLRAETGDGQGALEVLAETLEFADDVDVREYLKTLEGLARSILEPEG
jgi:hypothetical protein